MYSMRSILPNFFAVELLSQYQDKANEGILTAFKQ